MPAKKPRPTSDGGPVMVILEEIRSQNRAAREAVEAHYREMRRELQDASREILRDLRTVRKEVQAISATSRSDQT